MTFTPEREPEPTPERGEPLSGTPRPHRPASIVLALIAIVCLGYAVLAFMAANVDRGEVLMFVPPLASLAVGFVAWIMIFQNWEREIGRGNLTHFRPGQPSHQPITQRPIAPYQFKLQSLLLVVTLAAVFFGGIRVFPDGALFVLFVLVFPLVTALIVGRLGGLERPIQFAFVSIGVAAIAAIATFVALFMICIATAGRPSFH